MKRSMKPSRLHTQWLCGYQAKAFVFDTGVWTGLQKLGGTVFKAAERGGRNELVRTSDHAAAMVDSGQKNA